MKKLYVLFGFFGLVINFCDLIASTNIDSLNQELIESIRDQKSIEKIRQLLSAGADINAIDRYDQTALILAIKSKSKEVVELLLNAGVDVNVADDYGWTALMMAIWLEFKQGAELLLQAGADVNAVDIYGRTALIIAAKLGSKEIVKLLLLQPEINVNAIVPHGKTALMYGTLSGSKEVVEQLLQAKASIDIRGIHGRTALMDAVVLSFKDMVELLLKAGADVNVVSTNGSTAINLARSPEIKQMLMRYKAFRFIKIDQSFDEEPKPEDYTSDKAIIEGATFESTVAMIDEDDEEYGKQIEAFTNAHADWLRNQLQEAYEPFLYENNPESLLRFFDEIQLGLLPEVASFFNSLEDFLYVLNELKSHATGQVLNRLQKIIDHEEHIAKDIAARRIQ